MAGINTREVYRQRRRKRRRRIVLKRWATFCLVAAIVCGSIVLARSVKTKIARSLPPFSEQKEIQVPDWVDVQLIHIHSTARTGKKLETVKSVVIHYVGNPGTSAQNNRDYFDKETTEVSSHFVVGLQGEVIQCVPLDERSAASNERNKDSISIEVCHPDETGQFNSASYDAVVRLSAWLLHELGLDKSAVIRHYDITGKSCPLYYVEHEDDWNTLLKDIGKKQHEYEK